MDFLGCDHGKKGFGMALIDKTWYLEIMLEHFGVGRLEEMARGSLCSLIIIES
jgi:hypothetical protein